ncbi:MAG: 50S ribosomal protein L5 [Planctomycetes bacterium]|nr:50S ribosomal protein L5 [Planctomycetota bacterium]
MARLLERYKNEIVPQLAKELGRDNALSLPRLTKVVISMGIGQALVEKKRLTSAAEEVAVITGQRPIICKARKSVSGFKVREGSDTGLKVTLRKQRMYEFLDRLINVAIPRIRDFRGLNPRAFDGQGNYSMGVSEQLIFPEIDIDKVEFQQGMNITLCIAGSRNNQESFRLLEKFGMPFRKE